MRLAPNQYCLVDKKTGEVIDGPRDLPENWANVSGFHNLPPQDVKKYGWYPLTQYSPTPGAHEDYSLVFLPEKEVVARVHLVTHRGLRDLALASLRAQYNYRTSAADIPVTLDGVRYLIPNSVSDQMARMMCFIAETPYEGLVKDTSDGIFKVITIAPEDLPLVSKQVLGVYSEHMAVVKGALERIYEEDEDGLRALVDTDLAELYD
jgi:hypothetical protein